MTLVCAAERPVAHESVQHDLARPGAESEKAARLVDKQAQAGHFTVGPEDHRHQLFAGLFRGNGVPAV
jgi:hypothetical protein